MFPDISRSRTTARVAPRPITIFADPVRSWRLSLTLLLDTLNIQGPKPVALLAAIVDAASAENDPCDQAAIGRIVAAVLRVVKAEKLVPDGTSEAELTETVHTHVASALVDISPLLLQMLKRFLVLFPSWRPDGSGRVDNAPTLDGADGKMSFSQEEMHRVRHLIYCYLPAWTNFEEIVRCRRALLGSKAGGAAQRTTPRPMMAPRAAGAAPCALITVGPVGSGKSWVLNNPQYPIDEVIARSFGALFPAPPLADFAVLDPDSVLHGLCSGMGAPFDGSLRPYANFVNHENFCCALGCRKSLIFDGSARDPTNICGRVISRLKPAGYRIIFCVVLSSFQTARRRAVARQQKTGRETTESFTRFIYSSLQKALPLYLASCGERGACDGVLFFVNDTDGGRPTLEHTLVGGARTGARASEHAAQLKAAMRRGAELLALPPQ